MHATIEHMSSSLKTFYILLSNALVAQITNSFVWFVVTFWVFLETGSVLATSYVAGTFAVANMLSALIFGGIVDHNKKKTAMVYSSIASLIFYILGTLIYFHAPDGTLASTTSPYLWALIVTLILGSVSGNLRVIALSTTVSLLFSEHKDKANGMIGAMQGISFAATSLLGGFSIGLFGMGYSLLAAIFASTLVLLHLFTISLPETLTHNPEQKQSFDLKGTWTAVAGVSGLFALIFFTTFNNFLGGVFMALMDAYGLSLVSVETWGIMLSLLSLGFIAGSGFIARFGLGKNPLRRMLMVNVITWTVCIFFTIQPSIILLGIGMLIWMTLVPFIEAAEHTVIQSVVPYERQGRVFGFAQSIESSATPVTAFLIGPLTEFVFIPFMTTGTGVALIGSWFGTGPDRGIALVFITAGIIGLCVTLLAFTTPAYKHLSARLYQKET